MPRAWQVNLLDLLLHRPRVHAVGPVGVVAVLDQQRDRATERAAVPNSAPDLGAIGLDLHAAAAAMAELAAGQIAVDIVGGQFDPRRDPFDQGDETGAVRLTGG